MADRKIKEVLQQQLDLLKPTKEEIRNINAQAEELINKLKSKIRKKKIKANVFIGGSLAKGTLVKKEKYDIDIFVRFDKKYPDEEISKLLGKVVAGIKAKKIHGSRDYFQLRKGKLIYEIIPVAKISKPTEARNVTDLSYFHVNYIKGKIQKKKKLADEIILAKSFCYFQNCYGAESYIRGFSGYALELLVCYFGSFVKFLKTAVIADKMILDPKRFYKNKNEIMLELNESKLQSPIVFVDPTFKERNALAALSGETYEKFKDVAKRFLRSPSKKFFEKFEIDKKQFNFILEVKTSKQKGDIAGSKLKKFYEFLSKKIMEDFVINKKEFSYDEDKNIAKMYFNVKSRGKILIEGPPITAVEHVVRFKKKHKNCFVKAGKAYCRKQTEKNPKIFLANFKEKEKRILREMNITKVLVLK